jgi:Domain of Unknown Function (DUF1080)
MTLHPAFVLLLACAGVVAAADNQLTDRERQAGWKLLFDGASTTGWVTRGHDTLTNWQAVDGVLRRTSKGADAVYQAEQFENFELSVDWKIEDKGNSGVFVRVSSLTDWINTGAEIQILDINESREMSYPSHVAGALYDLAAPPVGTPRMAHLAWNHFHITCDGPKMAAEMNGAQTFAIDLTDEKWQKPQGKFKLPYATLPRRGYLMLQDHGDEVEFKNLKIRVLPAP